MGRGIGVIFILSVCAIMMGQQYGLCTEKVLSKKEQRMKEEEHSATGTTAPRVQKSEAGTDASPSKERQTIIVPVGAPQSGGMQPEENELRITLLKDEADAQWLCELFMIKIINEGVQSAFQAIQSFMPLTAEEISMLTMQTYQQLSLVEPRYGKAIGYSFVESEIVGDAIMRFVYLQKYEKHAIRWMFYFYKPQDAWMFNEFYFDDKLRELFAK